MDAEERARLDAMVVRLLKMHRRLAHKQLLQLVQQTLASSTQPGVLEERLQRKWNGEAIKACIEGLITKEYITRDESDR